MRRPRRLGELPAVIETQIEITSDAVARAEARALQRSALRFLRLRVDVGNETGVVEGQKLPGIGQFGPELLQRIVRGAAQFETGENTLRSARRPRIVTADSVVAAGAQLFARE